MKSPKAMLLFPKGHFWDLERAGSPGILRREGEPPWAPPHRGCQWGGVVGTAFPLSSLPSGGKQFSASSQPYRHHFCPLLMVSGYPCHLVTSPQASGSQGMVPRPAASMSCGPVRAQLLHTHPDLLKSHGPRCTSHLWPHETGGLASRMGLRDRGARRAGPPLLCASAASSVQGG